MPVPLLAARLVELRNQHGLSQAQVAEYLGMSREGYSHYERSAREPSLEAVVRLSRLYGIEISELVNEKTVLLTENRPDSRKKTPVMKAAALGGCAVIGAVTVPPPNVTANMEHLLKIFSGRNTGIDITDITREDIAVLEKYKRLDAQSRKEVRQFIQFKHHISKNKE